MSERRSTGIVDTTSTPSYTTAIGSDRCSDALPRRRRVRFQALERGTDAVERRHRLDTIDHRHDLSIGVIVRVLLPIDEADDRVAEQDRIVGVVARREDRSKRLAPLRAVERL